MTEIAKKRHQTAEGYTAALLSAFTFGLIPLFSVPLLADGMPTSTVLMYRFLFATLAMSIYVLVRKSSSSGYFSSASSTLPRHICSSPDTSLSPPVWQQCFTSPILYSSLFLCC